MKILDCTIRDGGYYTNWDFDQSLITEYCKSMEQLPIEYIEVGYRSIPLKGYLGKYFYCPLYVLEELKSLMPSKKLVIILNEKDIRPEHVDDLLLPIKPYVTLIRMAVDPSNFERAIELAKAVKALGFEVAFNVMYLSNWKKDPSFLDLLEGLDDTLDYFYMVDSFGGILPSDVKEIIQLVKSKTNVPLGFHGHDNLHMGLINTITALDEGCDIVDATITGMGRGAGNLKMELLLTHLNAQKIKKINFNSLSKVVHGFTCLQEKYGWGTNLPYMVSGANSLPQKDVMDWVSKGRYSFNSIIRALQNLSDGIKDNEKLTLFNEKLKLSNVLLVGGGPSVSGHFDAIFNMLKKDESMIIIHATTKHSNLFKNISNKQLFCLVGNEGHRMEEVFGGVFKDNSICVLPPYPRLIGTYIPNALKESAFQLEKYDFTNLNIDSHTSIALQIIKNINSKKVFVVGYDGYKGELINQNEQELLSENSKLFNDFLKIEGINVKSLFDTVYDLPKCSIYSMIL